MHVLFLLNTRVAKHGSYEDLLLALGAALRRRGDRATFVFPAVEDAEVGRALAQTSAVRVLGGDWQGARFARDAWRLIDAERPDVLNPHFCDGLLHLPLYAAARARGIRVVFHYHGEIRPLSEIRPLKQHLNALRLQTFPADEIVTVSHSNARFLRHLRVRPPVAVVHNGVDLARFERRPELAPPVEGRYVAYVGSLIARKRIDVLLRAFARVLFHASDLKLALVGGGEIDRYRRLAEALGIGSRVIFTGLVREYPLALLQHATVVASASAQESFGLIFAEALALGVPVVACRVGGVPEVVSDGEVGLLAQPDDVEGFAVRLERLVEDEPLRRACSARARAHVEERFALPVQVDRLIARLAGAAEA